MTRAEMEKMSNEHLAQLAKDAAGHPLGERAESVMRERAARETAADMGFGTETVTESPVTIAGGVMSKAETYQGKPCPHGHDGTRYASNMACVACAKITQARLYDRKAATARKRAYRAKIKESGNA